MKEIHFKLHEAMEEKVRIEAKRKNMNISEFIRYVLREHLNKDEILTEEVSKLGENINQIAINNKEIQELHNELFELVQAKTNKKKKFAFPYLRGK